VLQHRDGYLTEGSASNIWVVRDGRVIGVPRDNRILEGIRYGFMTELCAARGIPFETRPVPVAEVCEADELLLTGATREVLPIVQLDGRPVGRGAGAGRPGPVYAALRAAYDEAVDALKE
jgi:D-alanine transaminase